MSIPTLPRKSYIVALPPRSRRFNFTVMKLRSLFWFALLFTLVPGMMMAAGRLVSGPMLGYQTHRECMVWVETENADTVTVEFWPADRPEAIRRVVNAMPWVSPAGGQPQRFVLPLLEMGTTYEYRVLIDNEPVALPGPLIFRTTAQWEWRQRPATPPDFSFLFGSCAYFNDTPYDRPGTPYGAGTEIFTHMARSGADFMLWGGDNLYLRESDWSSESGIWYRYRQDRATPDLQPLLAAMPHYGTWDDHDFGPNNSNAGYEFKDVTLAAFKAYFGNRTWGEPDNPGVYGKFQWGDAAFFVLDNRYHRDESETNADAFPEKSQYGAKQMAWLRQNLLSMLEGNNRRHSPIRFIVTGGQFLSERLYPGSEDHHRYQRERQEIIDLIRTHRIPGVIILSGDVHYTELVRRDDLLPYPLYELTSSPLSSGAFSRTLEPVQGRIEGTAVQDQNYCKIAISGPAAERIITITCYSKTGELLWQQVIQANDLRWPEATPGN
jgi:alkaline phosphatase D